RPYYALRGAANCFLGDVSRIVYGPVDGETPTFTGPAPQRQNSGSGVQATGNISGWDPTNPNLALGTTVVLPDGIRDPYVENWFIGVQRQIRARIIIQLNY